MKLVEQVARAIYATDNGGIADRHPDGWIEWLPEARAALSVLAANVSDEMVGAFKDKMEPYTDGSGFNYKAALAAAIAAALPPLASGGG